jgi:putative ABC transport system permease protein
LILEGFDMPLLRDTHYAVRTLRRAPGFTAVVVITLALGMGATAAIFSIVNAVVLRPLDYPRPEQLVRITSELRGFGATDTGITTSELADYQQLTDIFAGVAGLLPISANVTGGDTPERIEMMLVNWNYFSVLGVAPAHGRVFAREDDTPGVANVAVVSDGFWRRRLGADPNAVGRTIVIDADAVQVVGVMPPGFRHPGRTMQTEVDAWSPAGFRSAGPPPPARSFRRLEGGLARLQTGVTFEQAQLRLADFGVTLARQYPAYYPSENGWMPRLVPLHDDLVGGVEASMFVLLCGVALLLLVACVNVAHLILARSSGRRQELAIRRSLGASGARLVGQLVTESTVLSAAGGVLGILVASWGLRALTALAPARVPRINEVSLDLSAFLVTAAICLVASVAFGFVPVLQMRRADTFAALKEGGAGRSSDARARRARNLLVGAEVAMATMLLVGAGLLVRTVVGLLNVPVGFETSNLLTARITLPRPNDASRATYLDPARRVAFYREALSRVESLPGVERAAMSSQVPMGGFNPPLFVEIDGRSVDTGRRPVVHDFQVSPSYFDTMGIRILRGRGFTDTDRAGSEAVCVVSEAAARQFWSGTDPVGQRLRLGQSESWLTVIGVAADVLNRRLSESPQPILYRTLEQASDLTLALLVRTGRNPPGLAEGVSREVRAVDPNLPVYGVMTMSEQIGRAVAQRRFLMRLLLSFGAIATGLALLGIYGVMAYSVSQRTREIGIRMAIGARQTDVTRMIMRGGLIVTMTGVVVGLAGSLALARFIRSQLFGVQPSDPLTLVSVLLLMTAVAAAAAYLPARRAASIDPVSALRAQ